MCTSSAVVVNL